MTRLTSHMDNPDTYIVAESLVHHEVSGYSGEAIQKLARFENVLDDLVASQIEIAGKMEILRHEGKTHSVKFKELMVKKLMNNNILILFKFYGLE